MFDETIRQITEQAVQQVFAVWADEHPALAAVIDSITVRRQVAQSLRQSDEYRQAVYAYHRSQARVELLDRLIELAGPIVWQLLG